VFIIVETGTALPTQYKSYGTHASLPRYCCL